jgi:hypothetical protein
VVRWLRLCPTVDEPHALWPTLPAEAQGHCEQGEHEEHTDRRANDTDHNAGD